MAQENITLQQPNFCIFAILGTFASVDTTNASALLVVKNTSGDTTSSYTFNPNIPQNSVIHYLDYIGPRNTSSVESGMVIITMESDETSEVSIKKWNLNKENSRFDLDYEIVKTTDLEVSPEEIIQSRCMTSGRYHTTLTNTTVTGTCEVVLNNTDTIVSGTRLYIGPSSNPSYLNAYEEVLTTSVSGSTVYIDSPNGLPLFSYYNAGDPVTYLGDFYLFSNSTETTGVLYTLDNYTGAIKCTNTSGLYSNITTANYALPIYNTIGLIKNSELLYLDKDNYTIHKSVRLNTTRPQNMEVINVAALAFTESSIFRLQSDKIIRLDTGEYAKLSWETYNYHEDSISRFSDSISVTATPTHILANQQTITLEGYIRDQYGIALSGKIVHFDKDYGDDPGIWSDINKEAITDINGKFEIQYTSGWYDDTLITDVNEDILVRIYTDGSNILTGSIYITTFLMLKLNVKFLLAPDNSPDYGVALITQKSNEISSENICKQIIQETSHFKVKSYSIFEMPGGHETHQLLSKVAILQQWRNFKSDVELIQEELLNSDFSVEQSELYNGECPVSQTYVSRHLPEGSNKDNVEIAQFKFIIDAIPVPFSEKNNVNSTIWIKLAPYGYDLNKSTLTFKVREVSYTGDTGFIDYVYTPNLTVLEYDAGGGLLGLELMYTPDEYFYNAATVYVYLEVYDNAIPTNRIEFDYWFTVIPDYIAPYVTNELPERNASDVDVKQTINFDIIDTEVGVNIASLDLFINNRIKPFIYIAITNGYRVTFIPGDLFYYGQIVEISLKVTDSSGQNNILYDMWRYKCISSLIPIIDSESFHPQTCIRGNSTRVTKEQFNIYDAGNGLDTDSVELIINGSIYNTTKIPIIKRIL